MLEIKSRVLQILAFLAILPAQIIIMCLDDFGCIISSVERQSRYLLE